MRFVCLCVAAVLGVAVMTIAANPAFAQGTDPKATDQHPPPSDNGKDGQKKIDEYAEAEKLLGGPAGNPECLWLGRRVVSLLWRDDLDTAFRHLDLYDRFGCPAGHIQVAFRCVVRQGNIDPKAPDSLNGRIFACWLNPNTDPVIPPASAAAAPGAIALHRRALGISVRNDAGDRYDRGRPGSNHSWSVQAFISLYERSF